MPLESISKTHIRAHQHALLEVRSPLAAFTRAMWQICLGRRPHGFLVELGWDGRTASCVRILAADGKVFREHVRSDRQDPGTHQGSWRQPPGGWPQTEAEPAIAAFTPRRLLAAVGAQAQPQNAQRGAHLQRVQRQVRQRLRQCGAHLRGRKGLGGGPSHCQLRCVCGQSEQALENGGEANAGWSMPWPCDS